MCKKLSVCMLILAFVGIASAFVQGPVPLTGSYYYIDNPEITGVSSYAGAGFEAYRVFDYDNPLWNDAPPASQWANGGTAEMWMTFDFGSSTAIYGFSFVQRAGASDPMEVQTVQLIFSDDGSFTDRPADTVVFDADSGYYAGTLMLFDAAVSARYVKFNAPDAGTPYAGASDMRFVALPQVNYATAPTPSDAAENVSTPLTLYWIPGDLATSHNVYFGTSFEDVDTATDPDILPGRGNYTSTSYDPGELSSKTTFYWRIDAVNGSTVWKGNVWSFTTVELPVQASNPNPADGGIRRLDSTLTWTRGDFAISHDVYFGTNFSDVNNAKSILAGDINGDRIVNIGDLETLAGYWLSECGSSNDFCNGADIKPSGKVDFADFSILAEDWNKGGIYKGNFDVNSFDPGILQLGQTYYWRVDEVDSSNTYKGSVWSFTTPDSTLQAGAQIENDYVRYNISGTGANLSFTDKQSGTNYVISGNCAQLRKGITYNASEVYSYPDGWMKVSFGSSGVWAVIKATNKNHYLTFEVLYISSQNVDELTFLNISLTNSGTLNDAFPGCMLALNLQTNVNEMPGSNSLLRAICYPKFGLVGAKAAVIGCPQSELRGIMKEVIIDANSEGSLPYSPLGGPWSLEPVINRGSYIFNFSWLTESTVDSWISFAQSLGMNQIDFHTGTSFRFGDYQPNPSMYPNGYASVKAVTDRLHAAGIKAGLHTYAQFIAKDTPWVTPIPDPRLAKDATFTLTSAISASASTVPVDESTVDMSLVTGFQVRNSVTIQIDNELITYSGIQKTSPYSFTSCSRGAYGTTASSHAAGAKVYHLKECFGLFVPDGESTLYAEVAQKTADAYNNCGFDMMYLDAIDGSDVIAGGQYSWYYAAKFIFELWKRVDRPALMEGSMFTHHFWYVRSRGGAWDAPWRGYKRWIDIHCVSNEEFANMFMPGELGWWYVKGWSGSQGEPTYPDDMEYLCCKAIGTDVGLAMMGMDPGSFSGNQYQQRIAAILRQYETLRLSNYFSQSVKDQLKVAGAEFTLLENAGQWQLYPVKYDKHKVEGIDGISNVWHSTNNFAGQPVKLRIEALQTTGSYSASSKVLASFSDPSAEFTDRDNAAGMSASLQSSTGQVKIAPISGLYTASNSNSTANGSYTKMGKIFSPTLNLSGYEGMGVWIYGDGKGEVLNFQIMSPTSLTGGAIGEHYVVIDFTGWKYIELVESDSEQSVNYSWPYATNIFGGLYPIFFLTNVYSSVEKFSIWYNNVPAGDTVACYLSPVKAVPLVSGTLINPSITIGGSTVTFPCNISTGSYIEFYSSGNCKLYNSEGALISSVTPTGTIPTLVAGDNTITFNCGFSSGSGTRARARVTVISRDDTPID